MKLMYLDLIKPIEFCENLIPNICIENAKFLREFLNDLKNCEKFVLSFETEIYKLEKTICLETDVFSLEISQRKIQNAIFEQLKILAMNDFYENSVNLMRNLSDFANLLINSSNFALENDEIDFDNLIKCLNIKIQTSDCILERVLDFMLLQREFLKIKLFVFVGLKSYLNDDEMVLLYQEIIQKKLNVLLIEPVSRPKLKHESLIIIDKNLCEIRSDY